MACSTLLQGIAYRHLSVTVTDVSNRTLVGGTAGGKSITAWALLQLSIMTRVKKLEQGEGKLMRVQPDQGAAFPQQTPSSSCVCK